MSNKLDELEKLQLIKNFSNNIAEEMEFITSLLESLKIISSGGKENMKVLMAVNIAKTLIQTRIQRIGRVMDENKKCLLKIK